jgi:hypothetical protein
LVDPVEVYSSELGGVDEDRVLGEGFREARRLGKSFARRGIY